MIAAAPGWRVVLVDRENGGSLACPIVAWRDHREGGDPRYLEAFYVPNEEGCLPRLVEENDLLGFLAPGDDHDAIWAELADAQVKREEEAEERALARAGSCSCGHAPEGHSPQYGCTVHLCPCRWWEA